MEELHKLKSDVKNNSRLQLAMLRLHAAVTAAGEEKEEVRKEEVRLNLILEFPDGSKYNTDPRLESLVKDLVPYTVYMKSLYKIFRSKNWPEWPPEEGMEVYRHGVKLDGEDTLKVAELNNDDLLTCKLP